MRPPGTEGARSLARGLAVLESLAGPFRGGARARDFQETLGIPRASLYRVLRALTEKGLVFQDPASGRYRLGTRMLELGFAARMASPLVRAVQPVLRAVAGLTHRMSELAVAVGRSEMTMLDTWQVEGTPLGIVARPGLFFQLNHLVAHGMIYLACDGERRLEEFLRAAAEPEGRRKLGIGRLPPANLRSECARVRRRGWVWRRQQVRELPRVRVAVPVFDPHSGAGRLAGSLGIVCGDETFTAMRAAEWAAVLRAQARELERAL